jgi:hypothetical protein
MAGDMDSLDVKMVFDAQRSRVGGSNPDGSKRRQRPPKEQPSPRSTKQFFHTMTKAAERSNQMLLERGLAFRFSVYLQGDNVIVDLVKLDAKGAAAETVRKNIAYEDFSRWIEDVSQIEGLFVDRSA